MSKQNFPFNLFHQIVSSWVYFISAFPSIHIYMAIWIHYLQAHILYPGNKIVFLIKFETAKYSLLIYLLTGVFCCFNLYAQFDKIYRTMLTQIYSHVLTSVHLHVKFGISNFLLYLRYRKYSNIDINLNVQKFSKISHSRFCFCLLI